MFDRVVIVREPLLIRVAFPTVKQEISVTSVEKNSISSAERAAPLALWICVFDCSVGPIA